MYQCWFCYYLVILSLRLHCRYVGNIHPQVTEPLLQEVFASNGLIEGCKLIRKEKVGHLLFNHIFWRHLFDYPELSIGSSCFC